MKRAVALGTFDGVHPGHRAVLEHPSDYTLTVITFDTPPKAYFSKNTGLIMTVSDRKKALSELGANETVVLDFEKVKDINATDFLEQLYNEYSPDLILCGFNFRFGKDASGDSKTISDFCNSKGISFSIAPPVSKDGTPLSSTTIRNLIASGDIEAANNFIYGGFGFTSTVQHGDRRGHTLGFPTINQQFPSELVKPKFGVYAGKIIIDGKVYKCITNIGLRPTFKYQHATCESYVFDFSEEAYGKSVTLKPLIFIREEEKFEDISSLKKAIKKDTEAAKNLQII